MRAVLVPRPQLLVALLVGAALVAAGSLEPLAWAAVAVYHLVLGGLVVAEAVSLPPGAEVQVRRHLPTPLSLGHTHTITVAIDSPPLAGLLTEVADHAPHQIRPRPRLLAGRVDGAGHLEVGYEVTPPTRGAFQFGPVDVRFWRPRGWWLKRLRVPLEQTGSVYPNVIAVRRYQLTLRRRMPLRSGQRRARPPGTTTAFAGLREYLPGDDFRRVNWKASARRDQPVTNEVEAERGQQVILALDCGRLMTATAGDLSKLDHAVNAALLLGWVAHQQGDRVGMVTFTDRLEQLLTPRLGQGQMHLLNEMLYAIRPQYVEPNFGSAFASLAQRTSRRSLVVVLTDLMDASISRELVAHSLWLARRHLVLVVAMTDPGLLAVRNAPVASPERAYQWAAVEEMLAARRHSFEQLRRGGVLGLDVPAGSLSPALVEHYLELKERALV